MLEYGSIGFSWFPKYPVHPLLHVVAIGTFQNKYKQTFIAISHLLCTSLIPLFSSCRDTL
jgi:hypothetical protein